MKICLVTATRLEAGPAEEYLRKNFTEYRPFHFIQGAKEVDLLITGVGAVQATYSLTRYLQHYRPDMCIQAGIAGSFSGKRPVGEVCNVVEEVFADIGAESGANGFVDAFEMGLIETSSPPFTDGRLINPEAGGMAFLPAVKGITVNTVSGHPATIDKLRTRYAPEVESMEGAAFFYTCLQENIPFLEVRSISNPVEERNPENWDIPLALENLGKVLASMIGAF